MTLVDSMIVKRLVNCPVQPNRPSGPGAIASAIACAGFMISTSRRPALTAKNGADSAVMSARIAE